MNDAKPGSRDNQDAGEAMPKATFLFEGIAPESLIATIEAFGGIATQYDALESDPYWLYAPAGQRLLEVHLIRDISEYELDLTVAAFRAWWLPLKSVLGYEPILGLHVYGVGGDLAEFHLRRFTAYVLAAHPGVVDDADGR